MAEKADTRGALATISVYPLKGGRGFEPASWSLLPAGLRLDRRWMLVDGDGRCITQLVNSRLALITPTMASDGLTLTAPGLDTPSPPIDPDGHGTGRLPVRMDGNEEVRVTTIGTELDAWCSAALGMPCRLVTRPARDERWVDRRPEQGHPVNFQNAFPVHLVSQASLDDLNTRLSAPVSMNRFRPNLIVSGTDPHEDDGWKRIQIGEAILRIPRACDHRCGVPNVNQETGERGVEPLRTLATYRRSDRGIYFGQNIVVERGGSIRVGDPVMVLERGDGLHLP